MEPVALFGHTIQQSTTIEVKAPVKLPNIFVVFFLCLCGTLAGQDIDRLIGLPLLVSVPTAPIPVRADGKYRLVYELQVVNAGSEPVKLVRTEIRDSMTLMAT